MGGPAAGVTWCPLPTGLEEGRGGRQETGVGNITALEKLSPPA